ncbi:MAG: polyvinylalcohol dehydrogenase [Planctomycetota bacterium]|nr:MAG: polyvinylalcohol dehydrogenase [Planctomycetota bacterium]
MSEGSGLRLDVEQSPPNLKARHGRTTRRELMQRRWMAGLTGFAVLIFATAAVAGLVSGTVSSVDSAGKRIVVETSGGKTQTFRIPKSTRIEVDGERGSFDDIKEGHRVSVFSTNTGGVSRLRIRTAPADASKPRSEPSEDKPAASSDDGEEVAGRGRVDAGPAATDAGWTQFRGPDRANRSSSTGLLTEWPQGGPPLAWRTEGLGVGYSSVSLADGKILTMGSRGEDEFVIAVDAADGSEVWATRIGATRPDGRGAGPRGTPTIDGDRVYALGANGDLACLELGSGSPVWGGNILQHFDGNNIPWGISESVLIDGNKVICTPGGKQATMAALDKETGDVIWRAKAPGNPPAAYASPIAVDIGGVRQYVNFTHSAVIGVRADNGQFLWSNDSSANGTANCSTPLQYGDYIFSASGYGTGGSLVLVTGERGRNGAKQIYHTREMKNHHGGMVIVGDHLYGTDSGPLKCLEVMSGEVAWQDRSVGKGSVVFADGHIILRSEGGPLALFEATPDGYVEKGRFDQPDRSDLPAWAHPVVADGKLFLRDQELLLVYDLRESR